MAPTQLINHHRTGSGSPLVLIHGIGATWQCWKPLIAGLSEHHDVFAVDLPGFGHSTSLAIERPSLSYFADSVLALMDHHGIDKFHVAGNSMGGGVCLELLLSGRVLSYTGISPVGQTWGSELRLTKVALRFTYYGSRAIRPIAPALVKFRPLRMALTGRMLGKPRRVTASYALDLLEGCARGSGFPATLKYAIPDDRPLEIPPFDGPAQVLWGTKDVVLRPAAMERFAKAWPGLRTLAMDGLGHVPMQDDPEQIVRLILAQTMAADRGHAGDGVAA